MKQEKVWKKTEKNELNFKTKLMFFNYCVGALYFFPQSALGM